MTEKTALDSLNNFLRTIEGTTDTKDRLFLAAATIELLRRAKTTDTTLALAALLAELPEVNWASIPFSVTKTALSQRTVDLVTAQGVPPAEAPAVILSALCIFMDFVQGGAELSTDIFDAIVTSAAADKAAVAKKVIARKVAPEIFNEGLVARAFVPAQTTENTLKNFNAALVYFRGELPGARLGPDIRGLAFDTAVHPQPILLETGELVFAAKNALNVAAAGSPEDFKEIPASLLLRTSLASVQLYMHGTITKEQETFLNSGGLGKPAQAVHSVVIDSDDLKPLEHVFDKGRESLSMGVTGPTGATVRFPVPDTDMAVVIDARHSDVGPYSVARLVRTNADGDDTILMRHDTPRLFTSRGVYIFPTKDAGLVSLVAI